MVYHFIGKRLKHIMSSSFSNGHVDLASVSLAEVDLVSPQDG
jgi:hypothetical protein